MLMRDRRAELRGGFTLMELLVVVAILVVLAGAAVPIYTRYLENSRKDRAWQDTKTLANVADTYKMRHGSAPTSLQELTVPDDSGVPYLETQSLTDPWGREYLYEAQGSHNTIGKPEVYSLGRNGNTQIGSWMPTPP